MNLHHFTGTGTLLRLILRRDRFLLPIWVLLPLIIVWGQVSFVMTLPDWQVFLAELTANPLTRAWLGPVVPLNLTGAILWRSAIQGALTVMIGSLLTVIRHTRSEEDAGRSELLRGSVVGRYAHLTAALLVTGGANLVAGLLVAFALMGARLPIQGAILLGLTMAAAGWFVSGASALAAQLRPHAGSARGLALALLGAGFVPMVINNMGGGYTGWAWLAPMIWYRLTQPFAEDQGWGLLGMLLLSAAPVAAAYALCAWRDLGAGLWQPRPGPAQATPSLDSPLALAWRLHKGMFIGWAVGLAFVAGALGQIVPTISEDIGMMLTALWPDRWADMVASVGNREAFMAVAIYMLALLAGVVLYAITTVLQLRQQERANLAELILANSVSRRQWMSSYLTLACAGSACLLLVLGLAAGFGWALAAGDLAALPRAVGMALSKLPAVWVMIGSAALFYGLWPRASVFTSWGLLVFFILIEILWEAQVVDWATMQWTPFAYVHYVIPIGELSILSLFGLTALAAVLIGLGLLAFQRRPIG